MSDSKDNSPFGTMTAWVLEYSNTTLGNACSLADRLRPVLEGLSPLDREFMESDLFDVIAAAAKLSAFAHDNLQGFSREWAELMMDQGYDRYLEYTEHVAKRTSMEQPPARWPISVKKAIDWLNDLEDLLEDASPETVRGENDVWQPMLEISRQLRETRFARLNKLGSDIAKLIDQFVVDNIISWADFVSESKKLIKSEKVGFIEKDAPAPWSSKTKTVDDSQ